MKKRPEVTRDGDYPIARLNMLTFPLLQKTVSVAAAASTFTADRFDRTRREPVWPSGKALGW